jgi:hypothetical protein
MHACLPRLLACLQLEAFIAQFPNMLPRGLGIKKGHSDSLAIRLQGPSATATHLRTAARNSGSVANKTQH